MEGKRSDADSCQTAARDQAAARSRRSLVAGSCACRVAGIAGQAFSPALEPPRSVSPNHRCRTSGVDAGRSLDSEILHVDGTTDAAGPAILFSAGNDGGNGGECGEKPRGGLGGGGGGCGEKKIWWAFFLWGLKRDSPQS